jgi:hypothetical protein
MSRTCCALHASIDQADDLQHGDEMAYGHLAQNGHADYHYIYCSPATENGQIHHRVSTLEAKPALFDGNDQFLNFISFCPDCGQGLNTDPDPYE